jgi:C1A family cysteine protease
VKQHGICTAAEYPFHGLPQTCKKPEGSFKIAGYTSTNNCNDLSTYLQKGPLSVCIDATNWSRYSSGIFNNCGTQINHAATLVGQINDNWKIQNSWGTSWG